MKRIHIVGDCLEYARAYGFDGTDNDKSIAYLSLKTKMYNDAIYNDGIVKTFSFSENCYDPVLDYIKIESKDIELYPDMFEKRTGYEHIYLHSQTDQDIKTSCLAFGETHEIDDKLNAKFEEIKEVCVKKYNGIYSSVEILGVNIDKNGHISIPYTYYYIKDDFIDKISSYDVIFGEAPLPYGEWFIDYFGLYPKDRRQGKDSMVLSKDVYKALNKVAKDDIADNSVITTNDPDDELVKCKENLVKTLKIITAQNAHLKYELEQCKEDKQVFPGYCMDCKNFEYTAYYDNNTKKAHAIDYCKHWSKEDSYGDTIFAETVADGYCYMFKPKNDEKDDTVGTWTHGICDNCGYDWSKDAPIASVPEYCPKCGQKKKLF